MARYIDADKLIEKWHNTLKDKNPDDLAYKCFTLFIDGLKKEPSADVVPKSEVEMLQAEKDALIKNYAECMKDYAREIFEEIEQEIELALESNYKAKNGQMMSEHITNEEREFIEYVNGKIHALGGISYFITELKKKYTESEGKG